MAKKGASEALCGRGKGLLETETEREFWGILLDIVTAVYGDEHHSCGLFFIQSDCNNVIQECDKGRVRAKRIPKLGGISKVSKYRRGVCECVVGFEKIWKQRNNYIQVNARHSEITFFNKDAFAILRMNLKHYTH